MKKKFFYVRVLADTNIYKVELGDHPFRYGEAVVIQTEFGQDLGHISSFLFEEDQAKKVYSSGRMLRYATDEDQQLFKDKYVLSRSVRTKVDEWVQTLELDMHITHILVPLVGKSMVIYYVATERVDFRELLKKLRSEFKEKITMRQISPAQRLSSFGIF